MEQLLATYCDPCLFVCNAYAETRMSLNLGALCELDAIPLSSLSNRMCYGVFGVPLSASGYAAFNNNPTAT